MIVKKQNMVCYAKHNTPYFVGGQCLKEIGRGW